MFLPRVPWFFHDLLIATPAAMDSSTAIDSTVDTGPNVTQVLLQYGVLGVLALTLGPFAYQAYKWQVARGDRAEAKVDEMQRYIRDQIVPALIESASANKASAEVAREAQVIIRDLSRKDGR